MSNAKNKNYKSILKGINYSTYTSILLTFIGTTISCFLLHSYQDFIITFVFMSLIISAITLFVSTLFGSLVILVLEEFNIESCITTSSFGGLLGYLIGFIIFSDWTFMVLTFCFYGTCCGLAFSYGYNKEIKK